MGKNEEVWERMRKYGGVRGSTGKYGKVWESMGKYGEV